MHAAKMGASEHLPVKNKKEKPWILTSGANKDLTGGCNSRSASWTLAGQAPAGAESSTVPLPAASSLPRGRRDHERPEGVLENTFSWKEGYRGGGIPFRLHSFFRMGPRKRRTELGSLRNLHPALWGHCEFNHSMLGLFSLQGPAQAGTPFSFLYF